MNKTLVFPGDFVCAKDDRHRIGRFVHVQGSEIRANCLGRIKTSTIDGAVIVDVEPIRPPGVVPSIGSRVLAKVTSLSPRVVRCDVVAVGNSPLAGPFRGIIKREDIRATQRDQAEPSQCFRPGDIIRARVVNLIGPGLTTQTVNTAQEPNDTLLAARAVSASVNATSDASSGTLSNAVCLLSTAEPDLGVVLGLGRSPSSPLVEILGSTGGYPLIPSSWTEMVCPHTLARFPRKVARVPDELLNQLVNIN